MPPFGIIHAPWSRLRQKGAAGVDEQHFEPAARSAVQEDPGTGQRQVVLREALPNGGGRHRSVRKGGRVAQEQETGLKRDIGFLGSAFLSFNGMVGAESSRSPRL
jgi:hypothetical protein